MHCDTHALEVGDVEPKMMRLACHVCMTPVDGVSAETLTTQKRLFENGQGSNHWPGSVVGVTDKMSQDELGMVRTNVTALMVKLAYNGTIGTPDATGNDTDQDPTFD